MKMPLMKSDVHTVIGSSIHTGISIESIVATIATSWTDFGEIGIA